MRNRLDAFLFFSGTFFFELFNAVTENVITIANGLPTVRTLSGENKGRNQGFLLLGRIFKLLFKRNTQTKQSAFPARGLLALE